MSCFLNDLLILIWQFITWSQVQSRLYQQLEYLIFRGSEQDEEIEDKTDNTFLHKTYRCFKFHMLLVQLLHLSVTKYTER